MSNALVITDEIREELRRLQQFAASNIISRDQLAKIAAGEAPPPGDQEGHIAYVPVGLRVVYSMEYQDEPLGLCHHLSVSLDQGAYPEKYPHPLMVQAIMNEIGFTGDLRHCVAYLEVVNYSANIIQPVAGAMSEELLDAVVLEHGEESDPIPLNFRGEGGHGTNNIH